MISEVEKRIIENQNSKEETLNLSGFNLREIPRSVFELSHLKELKLMYNKIEVISDEIIKLKNLSHLYLYDNKISKIPIKKLKKMYRLKCIDLGDNFVDLKRIQKLYKKIEKNRDYERLVDKIEELNENSTIFWFHGKIKRIPKKLFEFKNLEYLSINSGYLKKIPKEIGKLTNLKNLNFGYNKINYIPEEFYQISGLEEVSFDDNDFVDFPEKLLNMPNIRSISFNNNNITKIKKHLDIAVLNEDYKYFSFIQNPLKDFNSNYFNAGIEYIKEHNYGIISTPD